MDEATIIYLLGYLDEKEWKQAFADALGSGSISTTTVAYWARQVTTTYNLTWQKGLQKLIDSR